MTGATFNENAAGLSIQARSERQDGSWAGGFRQDQLRSSRLGCLAIGRTPRGHVPADQALCPFHRASAS